MARPVDPSDPWTGANGGLVDGLAATVCASLAYSFLPRPQSISSWLMTTSVFQCRTRYCQVNPTV
jgi:hypothetical protein